MLMASAGQTSTQAPQSTQVSPSTTAFSFAIVIATAGHSSTQVSQPVQVFLSTIAVMYCPSVVRSKGKNRFRP